jgi:hypothetical protein
LEAQGKKPIIVLLEETYDWKACEKKWVAFYRASDVELLNQTSGGQGFPGQIFSEEHRRKIGSALRDKKRPPEISAMLSRVHKGKVLSEETWRKMSEVRRGKKQSEVTKAKRSATMTSEVLPGEMPAY